MEDDSSAVANNQDASNATGSDAAADSQAEANTGDENQNTSQSTDTTGADDTSTNEGKDDTSASKLDTDLDDWAVKAGHDAPENDRERALLQKLRNGSREFTREQQAKKAQATFDKATTDAKPDGEEDEYDDPLEKEINGVKAELRNEKAMRIRSEYFNSNGVTMEETVVMGEILKEKAERGGKTAFDYWANPDNLQDLHDLAKMRMQTKTDTSTIEAEAARKERDRIAKESKANGSTRNATSTSTGTKTEEEARLERFSNWDPPKK